MTCIFCKIIKKEISAEILWETKDLICFLDIHPVSKGHCLVVTKKHFETIDTTPSDIFENILPKIKETVQLLKKKLKVDGFNIVQNNYIISGQEVPHLHFHIIPRYVNDDSNIVFGKSTNDDRLKFDTVLKEILN